MTVMVGTGPLVHESIGSISSTPTCAKPASDTSLRRAIFIRYGTSFSLGIAFAEHMKHRLSHRQPMYECYSCPKRFKTYGGMVRLSLYHPRCHYSLSQIIHLEYGTCGNIDCIGLNKLAAKCRKWRSYIIDEDCRDDLLFDGDTNYLANPFMCPTCQATVPKLSSLFQHIESSACEQTLDDSRDIGQLRNFLASRLG